MEDILNTTPPCMAPAMEPPPLNYKGTRPAPLVRQNAFIGKTELFKEYDSTDSDPDMEGEEEEEEEEEFRFFFGTDDPFSNWYPCKFKIDGKEFKCSEQYFMWKKATYFGDTAAAEAILNSDSPRVMKAIGRGVSGFNASKWTKVCRQFMLEGNTAKFCQNPELKAYLLDSLDTVLVEASPSDCIWGIGLWKDDPRAMDRKTWCGKNWLGEVLMEIREELKNETY